MFLFIFLVEGHDEEDNNDDSDDDHNCDTDGPTSQPKTLPSSVDHFTFQATVPGYSAIRNRVEGAWFIQALCKVLQEHSNK